MKPLNGKSAMTREERNARRRELDKDPFHRALTNKKQRERNAKNREKRLARRRAWYAAHREEECERQRRWSSEHRESKRRSWKKWADKHRDYLHERDARRSQTPEGKLRVKRQIAERRRRRNEDPAYAEHVRAVKRA